MKAFNYIFFCLIAVLLIACSEKEDTPNSSSQSGIIDRITIKMITRAQDDEDLDETDQTETDPDDVEDNDENVDSSTDEGLHRYFGMPFLQEFNHNSVVFVSQQTETRHPFQRTEDIYAYKLSEDAEEDEDGYFNFTPLNMDDPLEWFKIGNGGTYRGGFALYALYFPLRDEISYRQEGSKIIYNVEEDQSSLQNLIKSDILGAYHSNPTLFTRLNFNLFHLMTYLRIRLYVPVYNDNSKTGYKNEALLAAELDKSSTEFAIEWSTIRSSDTEGPAVSAIKNEGTIQMYMHPLEEGNEREQKSIKYTDFIPKGYYEQPIEGDYDDVKVYDFSVILPIQSKTVDENGEDIPYAQTNFLNFYLRSNSGATNKYYFNQTLKANSVNNNIQFSQGVFQYMELYVPRVGNQIIYVTGNLTPWSHHYTSLPLHNEDENN